MIITGNKAQAVFKNKKMPDGNVQEIVISSGDTINARQRLQTNLNGVM